MIESLVAETEWMETLSGLPDWESAAQRVLVIAPHPDDETLGAGGLIASLRRRGVEVTIAAVTDGENAYLDSDPASVSTLGTQRRNEQVNALAHLGVEADRVIRFGLTDSGVSTQESVLTHLLGPLITADTLVVSPWTGDFHPDHEACGRAAYVAAERAGAPLAYYFFWTWHRGTPELLFNPGSKLDLRTFHFPGDVAQAKASALACHRSQLERGGADPILPESLLAPARRSFEVFALA